MPLPDEGVAREAILALQKFRAASDPGADQLAPLLYTPDKRIAPLLTKLGMLRSIATKETKQEAGYVMESIAVLAFSSLEGWDSLKSYRSAGPQHDLLVEGSGELWNTICWFCYLTLPERRAIVVEAKAIGSRLADHDFARLCAVMEQNLVNTGIGIFFTIKGASGFPGRSDTPKVSLTACRLRQALYFANTKRPVIVFDETDIKQLTVNGALPRLIQRKVRE